mmetsp:Transcript_16681/g.14178  ORF Transcript_16681/g.14178 Transcript_16681/m.14178 type:complete len:107 (+) Transcript_16681:79-399(+)
MLSLNAYARSRPLQEAYESIRNLVPFSLEIAADLIHFHSHNPVLNVPPEPEPHSAHTLPHPIWDMSLVNDVELTHYPPKTFADKAAHFSVRSLRTAFDVLSGWQGA